jgi:hypothetical protein
LIIGGAIAIRAGVIADDGVSRGSENTCADILAGNVAIYPTRAADVVKPGAAIGAGMIVYNKRIAAKHNAVSLVSYCGATADTYANAGSDPRAGCARPIVRRGAT